MIVVAQQNWIKMQFMRLKFEDVRISEKIGNFLFGIIPLGDSFDDQLILIRKNGHICLTLDINQ